MDRMMYIYVLVGVATVLFAGWRMNLSIFYPYLMNHYRISDITPIAFSVTISSIVSIFSSPLMGVLYDRRGSTAPLCIGAFTQLLSGFLVWFMKHYHWDASVWLWYAGGAVLGFSFPALMMSINPTIINVFPSKPNIALAIIQTSNYLALTIWSPIISRMMFSMDVFTAILVLSIATTIVLLVCARMYSSIRVVGGAQKRVEVVQTIPKLFIVTLIPIFFIAASSIMLLQFIAPIIMEFCTNFGIDSESALQNYVPLVMGVSGVLQSVGAFAWGFVSRRIGVLESFPLLYSLQSVASFLLVVLSRFRLDVVITVLWLRLLLFGGEPVVHMLLIPTLFGRGNLGRLLGLQTSTVMVSAILGPLTGALARDFIGTFTATIALSALFSTIATVVALIIVVLKRREIRKHTSYT